MSSRSFDLAPLPRAAGSSIARAACAVLLLLTLTGCVFLPEAELVAPAEPVAPGPDPRAPRLAALDTRHFTLVGPDQEMVGEVQVLFTRYEDTFSAIAQHYNLGYEELRHANPAVDHWLPGEATPVFLPTEMIMPDAPREGIVINVPTMRLWYFAAEKDKADAAAPARLRVTTHPIGVGSAGWATPYGEATVTQKARDPVWYVPASVRKEHAERGDPLPSVVQPGPDNPLGRHALALSMPGYLIHGTNKPAGVGMRSSHGCIRLYPQDIEGLFDRVAKGTKVRLVNQPVLAGWRNGELFLEVHQPLAEDDIDLAAEVQRVLASALARAGVAAAEIDPAAVAQVMAQQRGLAFPVLRSQRTPDQYLAGARVVENSTPIRIADRTARVLEPGAN